MWATAIDGSFNGGGPGPQLWVNKWSEGVGEETLLRRRYANAAHFCNLHHRFVVVRSIGIRNLILLSSFVRLATQPSSLVSTDMIFFRIISA